MTFSSRRKRPITAPAKSTRSRTACSLFAVGVALLAANGAAAQAPAGKPASTFVPRGGVAARADLGQPQAALIVRAQATNPAPGSLPPARPGEAAIQNEPYVRLETPGKEKLFGSRETERELEERMRQEAKDAGRAEAVQFPERAVLTTDAYQPRLSAPIVVLAEPSYVVYRPLYFEEKNSERYGWDLGFIQPVVSTLNFYKDVALFPAHFSAYPHRRFETSAGQCRPGDPVPLLLYPPEITLTGAAGEAGLLTGLFLIVP